MMEQFYAILKYCKSDSWLRERMLFISGPRQVGKTTFVKKYFCNPENYYNWDLPLVRSKFRNDPLFFRENIEGKGDWVCFDEIHKRPKWKDILKGIYDTSKEDCKFVVTGSARLDLFKKSGDSLVGRYFETHMFPLNLGDYRKEDFKEYRHGEDLIHEAFQGKKIDGLEDLLILSGFPEPFFSGSEKFLKRWSRQHNELITREDIRDLSKIIEYDKIEILLTLIQPKIGDTVSFLSLGQQLEASHNSVKRWLLALEKVQLIFSISPWTKKINRALKKEKKWYYHDWCMGGEEKKFENFVASSLYRAVTLWTDRFGDKYELFFIRTHDGAEVDFLITCNHKPWLLVEAKEGKPDITSACWRFSGELNIPCVVVTKKKNIRDKIQSKTSKKVVYQLSVDKLLAVLP